MKLIELTKGKYTKVDDEDYEVLNKFSWQYNEHGYAVRGPSGKMIYMHREIMKTPKGMFTDHIDHDKLNNCKNNLRICNKSENGKNRLANKNSQYKGVYLHCGKRWYAHIQVNGKPMHIGCFSTPELAAIAYDNKAKELYGEFANLNFI